jgi:hypothetical protein
MKIWIFLHIMDDKYLVALQTWFLEKLGSVCLREIWFLKGIHLLPLEAWFIMNLGPFLMGTMFPW